MSTYSQTLTCYVSDYDMLLMVKQEVRGGVSTISNRFSRANTKYMGGSFDVSKPSSFLTYSNSNNLYAWSISKPLPVSGFRWMSEEEQGKLEKRVERRRGRMYS